MNKLEEWYWELAGVIEDAQNENGFDGVCLNTLKRVQGQIGFANRDFELKEKAPTENPQQGLCDALDYDEEQAIFMFAE